jgi:DNA-binding beta-propeller fold protein YncE
MTLDSYRWGLAVCGLICLSAVAGAQEERPRGPRVLAENLDNPSGVAVQPGTGDLFVAQHTGIVRVFPSGADNRFSHKLEIAKYPSDIYGKGPMYDIGPLGVAFLKNDELIVTDGSRPDAQELVRIYKVGEHAPESPHSEEDALYTLGPIPAGEASAKGEGNFYAAAVASDAIYVTSNGDDTKGWVLRAKLEGGKPGKLEPFIATKTAVQVDAPCGITLNKADELVVSQMGEVNVPGDSLLTIYDRHTGQLKHSYKTGLNDIIGIAYSPEGKLYAVDFAWMDAKQGGLFELTIAGEEVKAKKLMELDKPTALAFDKEGGLLITVFGTADAGASTKPGKLLRVGPRRLQQL